MTIPVSVVGTTVGPAMITDGSPVEIVGTIVPMLGGLALLVVLGGGLLILITRRRP